MGLFSKKKTNYATDEEVQQFFKSSGMKYIHKPDVKETLTDVLVNVLLSEPEKWHSETTHMASELFQRKDEKAIAVARELFEVLEGVRGLLLLPDFKAPRRFDGQRLLQILGESRSLGDGVAVPALLDISRVCVMTYGAYLATIPDEIAGKDAQRVLSMAVKVVELFFAKLTLPAVDPEFARVVKLFYLSLKDASDGKESLRLIEKGILEGDAGLLWLIASLCEIYDDFFTAYQVNPKNRTIDPKWDDLAKMATATHYVDKDKPKPGLIEAVQFASAYFKALRQEDAKCPLNDKQYRAQFNKSLIDLNGAIVNKLATLL